MKKSILCLIAACAVSLTTASTLAADKLAKKGEACGGTRKIQCEPGLSCRLTKQTPVASGVCS